MRKGKAASFLLALIMMWLSACKPKSPPPTTSPSPSPLPSNTPAPTPTPRELQQPTPTETSAPTDTADQVPVEREHLPDFTQVRLHAATFLEDPKYFQVSLDGWPKDAGEDVVVRVGEEMYSCDRLFPDQYPFRVYCWGSAPPQGAFMVLEVIMERVAEPLTEVPFNVPYLPTPTPTPTK